MAESVRVLRLEHLEFLVDELIKAKPQEAKVRRYMEAAGLKYDSDPILCMNMVLSTINRIQREEPDSKSQRTPRRARETDRSR